MNRAPRQCPAGSRYKLLVFDPFQTDLRARRLSLAKRLKIVRIPRPAARPANFQVRDQSDRHKGEYLTFHPHRRKPRRYNIPVDPQGPGQHRPQSLLHSLR